MQASVETNKQVTDEINQDNFELNKKLNKHDFEFSDIKAFLNNVLVQDCTYYPDNMDPQKEQNPTNVVQANNIDPPLEGGNYTKIRGMWTLKHETRSTKFNELLTKTELKGDADIDLNKFYNHINMCLNEVTRLR